MGGSWIRRDHGVWGQRIVVPRMTCVKFDRGALYRRDYFARASLIEPCFKRRLAMARHKAIGRCRDVSFSYCMTSVALSGAKAFVPSREDVHIDVAYGYCGRLIVRIP